VIDELRLDVLARMVVDDDIDRRSSGDFVVLAGRRVVDEGEKRAVRPVYDACGLERPDVQFDQVDERAVLLVGHIAAVEDRPLIDAGVFGDPSESERTRQTAGPGLL